MNRIPTKNDQCLCGKLAIKWKWSAWCCEDCDKAEKVMYVRVYKKDKEEEKDEN